MTLRDLGIFALAVLVIVAGLGIYVVRKNDQVSESERNAAIHAAKADALVSIGRQKDVQIASRASDLSKAEKDIQRLRADYARLRQHRESLAQFGTSVPAVGLPDDASGDPCLAAADELINAQGRLIEEQKAQILDLTASRDAWKGAFEEEHQRSVELQLALDAQRHAAKSVKWLGRIQGFAIGVGAGYVGGKL